MEFFVNENIIHTVVVSTWNKDYCVACTMANDARLKLMPVPPPPAAAAVSAVAASTATVSGRSGPAVVGIEEHDTIAASLDAGAGAWMVKAAGSAMGTAKANVAATSGTWYFEMVLDAGEMAWVGWIQAQDQMHAEWVGSTATSWCFSGLFNVK